MRAGRFWNRISRFLLFSKCLLFISCHRCANNNIVIIIISKIVYQYDNNNNMYTSRRPPDAKHNEFVCT